MRKVRLKPKPDQIIDPAKIIQRECARSETARTLVTVLEADKDLRQLWAKHTGWRDGQIRPIIELRDFLTNGPKPIEFIERFAKRSGILDWHLVAAAKQLKLRVVLFQHHGCGLDLPLKERQRLNKKQQADETNDALHAQFEIEMQAAGRIDVLENDDVPPSVFKDWKRGKFRPRPLR